MTLGELILSSNFKLPLSEIADLCRRYPVRELAVFGSALHNDFRNDSDVDLLVEFEPDAPVGMLTVAKMQRGLSELLHRDVDLVLKAGLKPLIRNEILTNSHVIYAN